MTYLIREAKVEDAKELERLMHEAYSIYTEILDGEQLPPLFADYEDEIKNYPTWILEYEGNMAGGLTMYFDDEQAYLSNVALHPMFKGKSLGRILIEFAEDQARDKGYRSLGLATHIKLVDNINYYKRIGYKETDRDSKKVYFSKKL